MHLCNIFIFDSAALLCIHNNEYWAACLRKLMNYTGASRAWREWLAPTMQIRHSFEFKYFDVDATLAESLVRERLDNVAFSNVSGTSTTRKDSQYS